MKHTISFGFLESLLYSVYIPLCMTVAMEDFLLLVGVGVVYLVALLAYNKFGKTKEE